MIVDYGNRSANNHNNNDPLGRESIAGASSAISHPEIETRHALYQQQQQQQQHPYFQTASSYENNVHSHGVSSATFETMTTTTEDRFRHGFVHTNNPATVLLQERQRFGRAESAHPGDGSLGNVEALNRTHPQHPEGRQIAYVSQRKKLLFDLSHVSSPEARRIIHELDDNMCMSSYDDGFYEKRAVILPPRESDGDGTPTSDPVAYRLYFYYIPSTQVVKTNDEKLTTIGSWPYVTKANFGVEFIDEPTLAILRQQQQQHQQQFPSYPDSEKALPTMRCYYEIELNLGRSTTAVAAPPFLETGSKATSSGGNEDDEDRDVADHVNDVFDSNPAIPEGMREFVMAKVKSLIREKNRERELKALDANKKIKKSAPSRR